MRTVLAAALAERGGSKPRPGGLIGSFPLPFPPLFGAERAGRPEGDEPRGAHPAAEEAREVAGGCSERSGASVRDLTAARARPA